MKRERKNWHVVVLLLLFMLLLPSQGAKAAAKPQKVSLDRSSVQLRMGNSITLRATISPASAKNKKLTWSSSDKKIARVNKSGQVTGVGPGTATITVKTGNGKTASCRVSIYRGGTKYTADTTAGKQTYYIYRQTQYDSYIRGSGCILTAVAIVSSHFGKNYSPADIHNASSSQKYGERYAVQKMSASSALYGRAAISVSLAAQILKDMGIKNKAVYSFSKKTAIKQITKHLKKGKPVLIKCNNKTHNGIRIANGHHAVLLVGIDKKGKAIFIDPMYGRINYAHSCGKYVSLTVSDLVNYHMDSAVGNYKTPYVTSTKAAGGYILVG